MTYKHNDLTRIKLPDGLSNLTETIDLSAVLPQVIAAQAVVPALPRHPVGLNVRQTVDYAKVLQFVKERGGVRSSLFHCDTGNLPRLHDFTPHVDVLIWRPREYIGEKLHEQIGPEAYIDFAHEQLQGKGFKAGDVWIHLHNESGWSDTLIEWERRAVVYALTLKERVVCLNPAVGNPHETQVHMARPILKLAGEHPESVIIGCHEYFSVWGNRTNPWYLGRWQHDFGSQTQHSFESYRKSVKELKDKPVRYLVTEWGADHISDDEPYTNTLPKTKGEISGVHTLSAVWQRDYDKPINPAKKPYPGLDQAYFDQLKVAWETGQYDNPEMIGALIYGWGNEWPLFDISGMSKLHELLALWRPEPLETQPEKTMPVKLLHGANGLILRSDKTPASTNLAELKLGEVIGYELPTQKGVSVQGNDQWLHVRHMGKLLWGWVSAYYIDIPADAPEPVPDTPVPPKPDPEPEPDPPAEPPDDTPNDAPATIHDVDKLRADMTAYANAQYTTLLARIDTLQARVDAYERIMRAHKLSIETELQLAG